MDAVRQKVVNRSKAFLNTSESLDFAVYHVMETIQSSLTYYDWVGIYWLRGEILELGPYIGKPTDHIKIPVGVGVCGTAVKENANQIINDVALLENYLACSASVRSEIVVLIKDKTGKILGQIDADSNKHNAFKDSDCAMLSAIADLVAEKISREANGDA